MGRGGSDLAANLPEVESGQQEYGELAGESLGRGNTDFRTRMGIDRAARFPGEHRAHHIADGEDLCALLPGFPLRGDRVRRFTRLTDADHQAVPIEDRVAIAKFASVIDLDGNVREPLDHEFSGESGVPAGAAGHDFDVTKIAELLFADVHLVEENLAGFLGDPPEQGVADRARLLED